MSLAYFKDKITLTIKDKPSKDQIGKSLHVTKDLDMSRLHSTPIDDYSLDARFMMGPNESRELQNSKDVELVSEVSVTDVVSPEIIYVTPKIIENIHEFKQKCRQIAEHSSIPEKIEINNQVLGFNELDGCWYRCVIVEKHELLQFKVQLLDYGTTHIFRKNNLRALNKDCLNEPYFCFQCKLFDITPNGDQWSSKSRNLIIEMIDW